MLKCAHVSVIYSHVDDEGMLDFFEDGNFVAHVIHLLEPDDVNHGEDFQCQWLSPMPAQDNSAERTGACEEKSNFSCLDIIYKPRVIIESFEKKKKHQIV